MYLDLQNKPRTLPVNIIRKACEYAEEYLGMNIDTEVEIIFDKDIGACGWALDMGDYIEVQIDKTQSNRQMIRTLLHELVHVDQYDKGRLVAAEGKKPYRWKGKVCRISDYAKQPWEIEAFDYEAKMYRNFMRKCKKEGIEL